LSLQGQPDITANATHLNAANKLLFAAEIDLPAPGDWRLSASGTQLGQRWQASGTLHVLSEEPAAVVYWPYFALVPACIALFVLNQYLKRQRLRRRLQ
ncbi:MAG: hypothetical protein JO061_20705, partial [Acidobacteriaceae bacterium]|nr:hypothetical protein [Acidobacteriaceae bacterium]